jgi:predicted enzyme related to lactoylglutathione lyase
MNPKEPFHPPIHFEIPVDDMDRATKFYNDLFGWDINAAPGFDDYRTIKAVPVDENFMTTAPGINGGMMKRSNSDMSIINYIDVEDIDQYLAKLEELGGQILMPKMPIKGIGYNAVVKDTEGNTFGMIQMDKNAA